MNSKLIIDFLNQSKQSDLIEITTNKMLIQLRKRIMNYNINSDGETLLIDDRLHNEKYLININMITSIKIIEVKQFAIDPVTQSKGTI